MVPRCNFNFPWRNVLRMLMKNLERDQIDVQMNKKKTLFLVYKCLVYRKNCLCKFEAQKFLIWHAVVISFFVGDTLCLNINTIIWKEVEEKYLSILNTLSSTFYGLHLIVHGLIISICWYFLCRQQIWVSVHDL